MDRSECCGVCLEGRRCTCPPGDLPHLHYQFRFGGPHLGPSHPARREDIAEVIAHFVARTAHDGVPYGR